jgi:hypothetical protein
MIQRYPNLAHMGGKSQEIAYFGGFVCIRLVNI